MTGQEAIHARIEEEAQVDLPRPRQYHHEGHQWPTRTPDLEMAEASPVALAFFSWQGAKPKVSLGNRAWPMLRDQMPEVMMIAPVAALAHHRIQAAGRERRKLL